MRPVLAAGHWQTNGDMMVDVARLYFHHGDVIWDATYGEGGFWTKIDLELFQFFGTDIDPTKCHMGCDPIDFRHSPAPDNVYDVTVFDPAYVSTGGRGTSTLRSMIGEYGMHTTEKSPMKQWTNVIVPGLAEVVRVTAKPRRRTKTRAGRKGGIVLFKVSNYISSGSYHNFWAKADIEFARLGLKLIDVFVFTRAGAGPQPGERTRKCDAPGCKGTGFIGPREREDPCLSCGMTGRVVSNQVHARNNYSFLLVGRKK